MVARTPTGTDVFLLPDLGEGLEEAELVEWCVHLGQAVQENDILAKMETAKALVDIPSPRAGTIAVLHGKPGQIIKVGAPLVTYRSEPAGVPAPQDGGRPRAAIPPSAAASSPTAAVPPATAPTDESAPAPSPRNGGERRSDAGTVVGNLGEALNAGEGGGGEKVLATPAVRRLARELGVDLEQVRGTAIGGRITADDVRSAVTAASPPPTTARSEPPVAVPGNGIPPEPPDEAAAQRIPFRGVRRTIAEHLRHSIDRAIHFTIMDEADISALELLRRKLMAASNEKITVLPFLASALCRVLAGKFGPQFARLNSTVDDERQEIVQHRSVHLGIATDTDSGLMVPVIRDADRLGVFELSRQIARLAAAARDRSIAAEQLHGSTFTISNFGSIGGRFGTPIINYPEAAILAVGRVRDGVVVRDGMLGVGRLLPLSLSADHRVIDGATAATALARIMELLQHPEELLTPVR